jgi:ABC-2 type transport system ATP-binding protein
MCVLMSTHTLTAAEEIANRVGIMAHSRLIFDGTIGELRERFPEGQQSLETMYLALTENQNGESPKNVVKSPSAAAEKHDSALLSP